MRKVIFLLAVFTVAVHGSAAYGEDAELLKDKFYNGLAEIIERNIDAPERCVKEVNIYYENNRETVKKIREWSGVAQASVAGSYSEFRSVSDSEIKGYQDDAIYAHQARSAAGGGFTRYKEALEAFMQENIVEGLQIIAKARLLSRG